MGWGSSLSAFYFLKFESTRRYCNTCDKVANPNEPLPRKGRGLLVWKQNWCHTNESYTQILSRTRRHVPTCSSWEPRCSYASTLSTGCHPLDDKEHKGFDIQPCLWPTPVGLGDSALSWSSLKWLSFLRPRISLLSPSWVSRKAAHEARAVLTP